VEIKERRLKEGRMAESERAIVQTKAGKIEGRYEEGVFVFKGVPYAAPPVGDLRWLPPRRVSAWDGVRPAFSFGSIAPQNGGDSIFDGTGIRGTQSEDCLYLNIWSPGLDQDRRPVLVWIHGGVFNLGSGSMPTYHGGRLAARNGVIVVTINYRLGMLGFLNLKEATEGRIPATGNEGLLDQMAALAWVRENIAAFGGDPGNVTVFGESAGGMSIGCMLAMPGAGESFDRAILQSGVGVTAVPLEQGAAVGKEALTVLQLNPADVDALRALPVQRLLAADMELRVRMAAPGQPPKIGVTAPVIDGEVLPEVPLTAIRQGSARSIPILVGTNLDEWKFLGAMDPSFPRMDEAGLVGRVASFVGPDPAHSLIEAYRDARLKRGEATSPLDLLSAIMSDFLFRLAALQVVEAQECAGGVAYNYLFTWPAVAMKGLLGACHLAEIGFVFGTYDDTFCGTGPAADRLSQNIREAWVAFARTGDPSSAGVGSWPRYGDRRTTMILDKECRLSEAPYEEERRAWDMIRNFTR
jgi:para-nitrobenzyl esterase